MKVCATAVGSIAVAACALGVALGACGGSTNEANNTGGDAGGSSKGTGSSTGSGATTSGSGSNSSSGATASGCTEANALTVSFAPMYTAVIPGDNTHTFAVPAIVSGIAASDVNWIPSNPSAVTLTNDTSTGGVLITVNPMSSAFSASVPSTTVTITAQAGGLCGTSVLTITTTTEAEWQAGNARYNDMVALMMGMGGPPPTPDGGARYACTDCHSATVPVGVDSGFTFSPYTDIAHTPEQTGGFSDTDLLGIVQQGVVPGWSLDGGVASATAGYFDTSITSYDAWHRLHHWNLTSSPADEVHGIVAYLRSLTPAPQDGTSNFGGHGGGPPPDGGYHFHHDGGFIPRDGGFGGGGHGGTDSGS